MKVKATQKQYNECVDIYNKDSCSGVYEYADKHGITSWSLCPLCEVETPDTFDDCCLCCGTKK